MTDRKVLFVLEGNKAEPRLLKKSYQLMLSIKPQNIFRYGADVHQLIRSMFPGGEPDENLDLLAVLREKSDSPVLSQEYAQVFLVFDMDPQDGEYDPVMMRKALEYFDNPTENGKLYINYPMVESYRHLVSESFDDYRDLSVTFSDIKHYKNYVNTYGLKELRQPRMVDSRVIRSLIVFNLRKLNFALTGDDEMPDSDGCRSLDLTRFFDIQSLMLKEEGCILVMNTFLISIVDYNPVRFLEDLNLEDGNRLPIRHSESN